MRTGLRKRKIAWLLILMLSAIFLCGAKRVNRGGSSGSGRDGSARPADSGEAESLLTRLEGKYSCQLDDGEIFCLELTGAYGNLYGEGGYVMAEEADAGGILSPYSFYGMELIPEKAGAFQETDTEGCDVGILQFSVMSNLGKYQGAPYRCRIVLTQDGMAFESIGNEEDGNGPVEAGTYRREFVRDERVEDTFPYYSSFPGAAGGNGTVRLRRSEKNAALERLRGIWREKDCGEELPYYLEFTDHKASEADGTLQLFRKAPGEEVFLARGSFCFDGIADAGTADGRTEFHAVYSVLGNGSAPTDDDLVLNGDGSIVTGDGRIFERIGDGSEIPLTVLVDPDDASVFGDDHAAEISYTGIRPLMPQFAAAEETENNGGYFVGLGDCVYFRTYGDGIRQENIAEGAFLTGDPVGFGQEGRVFRYDLRTGEIAEAFADGGTGPLWYLDGKFYTQVLDPDTGHQEIFRCFPDGSGREQMTFGGYDRILCASESGSRLCIFQEDDSRWLVCDGTFYPETFEPGEDRTFVYFCFAGETPVYAAYSIPDDEISVMQRGDEWGEEIRLGTLPESGEGAPGMPEVVQHFYDGENLYLGLAWYNGPEIDLDDYMVVRVTPGVEDSLVICESGVPDGYDGPLENMPRFFLNYADEVLFSAHDPDGEAALSEGAYGDLMYFDSPFSVMPLIPDYIPEDPFGQDENGTVRILQDAEYAGGSVWTITAEASRSETGWETSLPRFDLEDLYWSRIPVDGIPMTGAGDEFEEEALLCAVSGGGDPVRAWYARDRFPKGLPDPESYDEFLADDSEYQVKIWFEAGKPLPDFVFYELYFQNIDENGEAVYQAKERCRWEEFSPERPLLIGMTFYGDMTEYAVSYTGDDGEPVYYAINISGKDGSLNFRILE